MQKVNASESPGGEPILRREALKWMGIGLLAHPITMGCKTTTFEGANMSKGKKVIIVLTNHEQLGNTGRKTGFYLSEVSHPYEEFEKAGLGVDFVSPEGGVAPMDGADRNDAANAAFLDNPELVARTRQTLAARDVDASN
jgi:hypothetical protein